MDLKLIIRASIAVTACLLVGFFSSIAIESSVYNWFLALNKPIFDPPTWIFAPAWIFLYVVMGIAAGIVWNKGFYHKWVKTALYHFGFQLILTVSWSVVFFGLKALLPALLIAFTLFIVLLFTYKWFRIVDPRAGYFLIPYIIWTVYTVVFNFEIWRLN